MLRRILVVSCLSLLPEAKATCSFRQFGECQLATDKSGLAASRKNYIFHILQYRGGSDTEEGNESEDGTTEKDNDESKDDEEREEDDDDDDEEAYFTDEYDEYDSSDEDVADSEVDEVSKDIQYFMPSSLQLYATFGSMMLSRRVNFFDPTVVRLIRFAFITQIIIQQLFVLYVRLAAKRKGDSTKVDTRNPAMDILTKQLQLDGGAQEMAKKLASKFLSSETTVMEYDLKQAADMQGGVLVNMAFMWFLHFKMEKVQPLLIQVVMGFLQLLYSPLFQVYVLGRNLERPFKAPKNPLQDSLEAKVAAGPSTDDSIATDTMNEEEDEEESS